MRLMYSNLSLLTVPGGDQCNTFLCNLSSSIHSFLSCDLSTLFSASHMSSEVTSSSSHASFYNLFSLVTYRHFKQSKSPVPILALADVCTFSYGQLHILSHHRRLGICELIFLTVIVYKQLVSAPFVVLWHFVLHQSPRMGRVA